MPHTLWNSIPIKKTSLSYQVYEGKKAALDKTSRFKDIPGLKNVFWHPNGVLTIEEC